ncbi:glycosyltransferase family 2 protein [Pseudooceanicola sp. LIPI14-2-Ac024]|uniref:glycosyltransferase family 2 protein n=1 Tax=Pseudooceanicola sp. LIPI14-2-Ac024 TaxID=3344875 RepID=UPI0035D0CE95
MRVTAVTCVKNEGPFLLEWIAYNRLIGVTDFLFYSNDCSDGTDSLLDALAGHGLLHHLPNPAKGRHYQMEALKAARRHPAVTGADWVWIADVDEFLDIHAPGADIPGLVAACGEPAAISVHFQFFGNGGVARFEDRPVIAQFSGTHDPDIWNTETAIEVKSLVRKDFPLQYFGAHRPFPRRGIDAAALPRWTDGSGRPVPPAFALGQVERRIRRFPAKGARRLATLNHYALRSLDSYLVKCDRGDVNRARRDFDATYWQERADVAWQDRRIQRHLPALVAGIAALKALPGIAALHDTAVERHRARIAALDALPGYRALRAALGAAPTLPPRELALIDALGVQP